MNRDRLPLPIVVLSYNRPDYLAQVLASLRPQLRPGDRVFLFQDGAWSPFSGTFKTDERLIAASVAAFAERFPTGSPIETHVFGSSDNLGIAGNYRRAEAHIFETLGCDYALFLEDDLFLSSFYLEVISDLLQLALAEPRIGYVSAYGDMWAELAAQRSHLGQLTRMHENWGAALTRQSWLAQKPLREAYWALVRNDDYSRRDHARIRKFYHDRGYNYRFTSQDASRWVATLEAGMVRVMPRTCHARYIGASGEHSRQDFYDRHHFDEAVFYPGRPVLQVPSAADIDRWLAADHRDFAQGYVHSYQRARPAED